MLPVEKTLYLVCHFHYPLNLQNRKISIIFHALLYQKLTKLTTVQAENYPRFLQSL